MSTGASADLVARLDARLPQTQCTRCGYPDCRAYAEAMAAGRAAHNRCPPGGEPTLRALAELLERAPGRLDPDCGAHEPRTRAVIDEAVCIGCRKCIDACPVDAIVGARKLMHSVLAPECTGCGLCLPPCPVDCIALVPAAAAAGDSPWPEYGRAETERWRVLAERRRRRLAARAGDPTRRSSRRRAKSIFPPGETIRAEIAAALERVRARRTPRR